MQLETPVSTEPYCDSQVTWDSLALGLHDIVGYGSMPSLDDVNMYDTGHINIVPKQSASSA
jgi:hypothetical protein